MEEKKLNINEIKEKSKDEINRFIFIVFIPNPLYHTVQYYVDGGEISNTLDIDEFIDAIKVSCNYDISLRFKQACTEYGTPFLYDREKDTLKPLKAVSDVKTKDLSEAKNPKLPKDISQVVQSDNFFQGLKNINSKISTFGTSSKFHY